MSVAVCIFFVGKIFFESMLLPGGYGYFMKIEKKKC